MAKPRNATAQIALTVRLAEASQQSMHVPMICIGSSRLHGLIAAAVGHEADTGKAQDHHGPGGGFGNCGNRNTAENPAICAFIVA